MTNSIQSPGDIKPMQDTAGATDPLSREYQEGKRFLERGDYGQAAVALHNALVGFEEKNDKAGIANASNQLGHVCLARGDYRKALAHYQRAHTICDELFDRASVLAVAHKIVEAYSGCGEFDQAVKWCLDIVDIYHDNRDPQGTVTTLETLADIYVKAGQPDKAADTYRTIASIHRNFRHETSAAEFEKKALALEG